MLEMIIDDVVGTFRGTFLNGDMIALAIAFGSVVIAALVMRRGTQIGSMTLLALVLFVLGGYLRGVFAAPADTALQGSRMVGQLERSWTQFMGLQASALLAYFIAFMLFIFILFALKSVVARG